MEEVEPGLLSALLLGGHMLLVAGLATRILFRHLPVGTTLAWLIVLFVLPVFGPALYLFIGENRLGQKRAARWRVIHDLYREWQGRLKARADVDWDKLHPRARSLASHGESITGFVALQGHELELLPDWDRFVDALVADIEAARSTCHLAFYIWDSAGRVGEVYTALARASASPEFPLAGLARFWPSLLVGAAMESGEIPPSRSSVGYRDHSPKQRAEKSRGKREQKNMQLLSFRLDLLFEKQPELVLEHGPPDDYKKYKYRGDRGRKPPGSIHIGHRSVSVFAHSPAQLFPAPG